MVPSFAYLGHKEELSPRSKSKIHLERTRSNTTSQSYTSQRCYFLYYDTTKSTFDPIDQYIYHLNKKYLTSTPPTMLSLPTSPPLAVTRSLLQLQQSQINLATRGTNHKRVKSKHSLLHIFFKSMINSQLRDSTPLSV